MTEPLIQLFVNPTAGSASARLVRALGHELATRGARVIVTPAGTGPLTVAAGATLVCAVGGDGTLRHVADAIARSGRPVPMSIFPTGTVNLLARELGHDRDVRRFAAHLLASDTPRAHHLARIGDMAMFTCASVGPDSRAVAGVSLGAKRAIGRAAYGLAFLSELARWTRPQLRVTANGATTECEAVYVAKGHYYAGPWSFAPAARAADPLLHVVALRRARRRDFLLFCWMLLTGRTLREDPNLVRFTCDAIHIGGGDAPVQADGDIVARLPVDIGIDPHPIAFV